MNTHSPEKPWQKNYIKRPEKRKTGHMGIKRLYSYVQLPIKSPVEIMGKLAAAATYNELYILQAGETIRAL